MRCLRRSTIVRTLQYERSFANVKHMLKGQKAKGRQPGRRSDGARTVETILHSAANIASKEGLQGLTIGTLAERLGMSKSGLFAHFGSKQELQLATIEAAANRVTAVVIAPTLKAPRGIARLTAACDKLIEYLGKPEFPG